MIKKYVIGCDNAAVKLKLRLIKELEDMGYEVEDVGANDSNDPILYPEIAERAVKKIIDSNFEKYGILVCGTGIGMAMTANKFQGIYAAVCHDAFSAERAILSNDANVLCMGERVIGEESAVKILKEWLKNEYVLGTRSQVKVEKLREIDHENRKIG